MALDWSIIQSNGPVDVAGNFARGFQMGEAIVDKFHERNALAALASNPDDPQARAALYQSNPSIAAHLDDLNFKRHDIQRKDQARSALGDFILSQPGMQPQGLTGQAPVAMAAPPAPAMTPAAAPAPAPTPQAGPSAAPPADDAITVTGQRPPFRTTAAPMSDAWAQYVHADPQGAMKTLIDRAKLGSDQAKALAAQMDVIASLTRGVTDQASYTAALQQAQAQGFDVSHLPQEYNPRLVASIQNQAMSAVEYLSSKRQDRNVDSEIQTREGNLNETTRHHQAEEGNTRRGQDLTDSRGRRGQDIEHGDRVRGQDIGSRDRERGQDIGSQDRQRGQDMRGHHGSARPTIIVNPQTGQRMKLENGRWVPA
jgi:hypothetical protein